MKEMCLVDLDSTEEVYEKMAKKLFSASFERVNSVPDKKLIGFGMHLH